MKHLINVYGTGGQGQGYSGAIEQTVIALNRRPDIDVTSIAFNKTPEANISPEYAEVRSKPFQLADVGVVFGFPSAFNSNMSRKFRVGYTMFETDTLPRGMEWAGLFEDPAMMINNSCDLLLVPCEHNREVFKKSGVTIPIEVVPLGINPKLFPYIDRSPRENTKHKYTFFMYGTLTLRKNAGMVISAFASLFRNNPDVRLVLKTQSGTLGHVEYVDMGDIEVIDALWTHEKLLEALSDADCFVFPSRGEGFGLPPLEAMSTGLATIVADNTGMSDYANPRYNIAVPTKQIVPAQRYPHKWGDVGNWYDPDYDKIKEAMLWCYEHQTEATIMGDRASVWVQENWTYDQVADKLVEVIKKHYKGWQ